MYMRTRITTGEFIDRCIEKHGTKYDYTSTEFKNFNTKILIICKKHGEFLQRPYDHLNGCGCRDCQYEKLANDQKKKTSKFIKECNKVHDYIYDYSKVEYKNAHTKVCIICPEHGEFKQTAQHHLNGSGCPRCNYSKGERIIRKWLTDNDIPFYEQYGFIDCRNERTLPFDFYLPDLNMCIEYDGIQHFTPRECFGGEKGFNKTLKRDKIKTEYCKENNILLVRIRYNQKPCEVLQKYIT